MKGTVDGALYNPHRNTTSVRFELEGNQEEYIKGFVGKHIDVGIKAFKRQRSLDANRYYWELVGKLRYATGQKSSDIYRDHIKEVGGNTTILCTLKDAADRTCEIWESRGLGWITEKTKSKLKGCVTIICYRGSSSFDTRQMSKLIDLRQQDCRSVGVDTRSPEEVAKMMELWGTEA